MGPGMVKSRFARAGLAHVDRMQALRDVVVVHGLDVAGFKTDVQEADLRVFGVDFG